MSPRSDYSLLAAPPVLTRGLSPIVEEEEGSVKSLPPSRVPSVKGDLSDVEETNPQPKKRRTKKALASTSSPKATKRKTQVRAKKRPREAEDDGEEDDDELPPPPPTKKVKESSTKSSTAKTAKTTSKAKKPEPPAQPESTAKRKRPPALLEPIETDLPLPVAKRRRGKAIQEADDAVDKEEDGKTKAIGKGKTKAVEDKPKDSKRYVEVLYWIIRALISLRPASKTKSLKENVVASSHSAKQEKEKANRAPPPKMVTSAKVCPTRCISS